ncbi:mitochondrial P-loop NTPase superfamily member [Andalucia godoyi]|uniref:Mitochondrial P-loop NTPase superfamily member n=1 Tax=Andalucia godoyi TaxID=505711 RepID=A0A8K0AH85_ANDGO|nr:mitochondrial P-loop NTPase superfamily member [Andalucia godoyi]|eukprot:ANDGO_01343.mRNA.1 mitochondrial P-loop NTPase superfamily member
MSTVNSTTRRVLVFGSAGQGKSSLINNLLGREVAPCAEQLPGVTFETNGPFQFSHDGVSFDLFDTAGLNETAEGSVPAEQAANRLMDFVLSLKDGLHLILFVMNGRMTAALEANFALIQNLTGGKVPVVLVVSSCDKRLPERSNLTPAGEMQQVQEAVCGEIQQYTFLRDCAGVVTTITPWGNRSTVVYREHIAYSVETLKREMCSKSTTAPVLLYSDISSLTNVLVAGWNVCANYLGGVLNLVVDDQLAQKFASIGLNLNQARQYLVRLQRAAAKISANFAARRIQEFAGSLWDRITNPLVNIAQTVREVLAPSDE